MSAFLCLGIVILHSHIRRRERGLLYNSMEHYEILLTRVWKDCLICIWNNAILFNLIYAWAFYSNRVEQFVPAGKKGLLVTERLFVLHYAIRHSEENCGDSPSRGCMWLC